MQVHPDNQVLRKKKTQLKNWDYVCKILICRIFEERKWSPKRRCAYFIFPVISTALIQGRSLFEIGTYSNYGKSTEGNKLRINWKYVLLELLSSEKDHSLLLLYKPGFTSRTKAIFLKRYGFDLFISSAVTKKVGRWFVNSQISAAVLIRVAALNRSFRVLES